MAKITEAATNVSILSLDKYTSNPNSAPLSSERLLSAVNNTLVYWDGTSWVVLGSGGGGGSTWESLYAADNNMDVVGGNGFSITGGTGSSANDVLTILVDATGTGDALQITNAGSGADIKGTSNTWNISKTGIGTFLDTVITGTTAAITTSGAAVWTILDNSATSLSVDTSGATGLLVFDTQNGVEKVSVGATLFQVTAGGSILTNASNSVSTLLVTNNTATTFGAAANSSGVAVIRSTSLTTGSLLQLQLTEGTLNGGFYLTARDVTGSANVLTIGEDGATVIAGVSGSNMLTVTAGNILASEGSITANYDGSTTTTIFNLSGSGAYTGNTTSAFTTITPSGLTSGTAMYIPVAALTTGKALHIVANAATDGLVVDVTSTSTLLSSTGRLLNIVHSGNATVSGVIAEISSAAADETVILKVTASAANALGTAFAISSATTTGNAQTITANSLTSGKSLLVTSSSASTDASTSFEPALFTTTMTGIGGVGGRVRAYMTTNVALGAWSNALKGEVVYGASGATNGLGSSILAEMTLSAGTTTGTYAPLEVELNLGSNAPIGTNTSFAYLSANGTATNFISSGYVLNLQGLGAATSGKIFQANTAGAASHALKIIIGSTPYYIMLTDTGA